MCLSAKHQNDAVKTFRIADDTDRANEALGCCVLRFMIWLKGLDVSVLPCYCHPCEVRDHVRREHQLNVSVSAV